MGAHYGKRLLYTAIIVTMLSVITFVAQHSTFAQSGENCAGSAPCKAAAGGAATLYLPLLANPVHPPTLHPIANADQTNVYSVYWETASYGNYYYILQEAENPSFTNARVVYQSTGNHWSVPQPGKLPGTYYYRVGINVDGRVAAWSNTRAITIHPLFVGLQLRWDGVGYLNIGQYYEPGVHRTRHLESLTTPNTAHIQNHVWYDPDPLGFGESTYDSYYSVTTGEFLSSSSPSNPAWKWGYPWLLPYNVTLHDGQVILIDGQKFDVSGPHSGYTAFGQPVQYWQMVNRDRFLLYDDGSEWTQYIHPGEAILRYDAGHTRLLLHYNVLRHHYRDGELTEYTVHYITNLTESNSFRANEQETAYEPPVYETAPAPSEDALQLPGVGIGPSYPGLIPGEVEE